MLRQAKSWTDLADLKHVALALVSVLGFLGAPTCLSAIPADQAAGPRFEVSFPPSVHRGAVTGRLFVLISHRGNPEPRLQSLWFNSPEIIAVDVSRLESGERAIVDSSALGTPLASLHDLEAGDYYVQAVLNVYTQVHRADGHVLWAHLDQGEGQQFNKSPGNLYSKVARLHLDGSRNLQLSLTEVMPPILPEADTEWIKHLRLQSKLLTRFWGRPIYLGAVILLPRDYHSDSNRQYPVIYYQPEHFRSFPPFEFTTDPTPEDPALSRERQMEGIESGYEFYRAWASDGFPQLIAVSLQTPTPLSDWSGAIDSDNTGPYAQAIMTELIPAIEEQFRIIRSTYARVVTGKDSGGRAALALQLQHADFFGGAWIFHPWPFNFEHWSSLNIYDNQNAFRVKATDLQALSTIAEWLPIERMVARTAADVPLVTLRQLSRHDAVMAGMAAGDPIGADDAINGPVGPDGRPKRLWDRKTGAIDRKVAEHWRQHGDLAYYARTHWTHIGPHLLGKLHFYVGDRDEFYRAEGVRSFEKFLKTTQDPHYEGTFVYGTFKGSWQPMTNAELVKAMAAHIAQNAPKSGQP